MALRASPTLSADLHSSPQLSAVCAGSLQICISPWLFAVQGSPRLSAALHDSPLHSEKRGNGMGMGM
eukprot:6689506-Alexandrium_andersonii.AAC.1